MLRKTSKLFLFLLSLIVTVPSCSTNEHTESFHDISSSHNDNSTTSEDHSTSQSSDTSNISSSVHIHLAETPVEENRNEATCTEEGSYDLVTYCSECEQEISKEHIVIPALGHEYEKTSEVDRSFDGSGSIINFSCSRCGDTYSTRGNGDKMIYNYSTDFSYDECFHWNACLDDNSIRYGEKRHTFNDVVTEPTLLAEGYTTHTCIVCGYSYIDYIIDKLYLTVTWLNYDGTILETDKKVEYGSVPVYHENTPEKYDAFTGFSFVGWEPELTAITENQTYIAKYEPFEKEVFSIAFNLEGGSNTSYDLNVIKTKNKDTSFKLPSVIPVKEDCVFKGWNNIYESKVYDPGDTFEGNFDVEFCAMWYKLKHVDCDECDGLGYTVTKTKCPNYSYCSITGWIWTCNRCGAMYARYDGENVNSRKVCPNCKLAYLSCSSCSKCGGKRWIDEKVDCSKCCGEGYWYVDCYYPSPKLFDVLHNKITLVSIEGYEYSKDGVEWQISPVFDNLTPLTEYTFYQRKATNNGIPFGVTSQPLVVSTIDFKQYSITYVLNGGVNDPSNPLEYNSEDNDIILANPVKSGSSFDGWYSGSTPITIIPKGSKGDLEIEAKWIPLDCFKMFSYSCDTQNHITIDGINNDFRFTDDILEKFTFPSFDIYEDGSYQIIIGDYSFELHSFLSVDFGNSVISIGNYAFRSNRNLESITISDSVTSIGEGAFQNCNKLDTIVYKGTVQQWSEIELGINWNYRVPATVVHCIDGDAIL